MVAVFFHVEKLVEADFRHDSSRDHVKGVPEVKIQKKTHRREIERVKYRDLQRGALLEIIGVCRGGTLCVTCVLRDNSSIRNIHDDHTYMHILLMYMNTCPSWECFPWEY